MDPIRFDRLTLQVGDLLTRRGVGVLLSLAGVGAGIGATSDALGKKKKKKKCKSGTVKCGKTCVNPQTDLQNCGACGNACGSGQICQGGQCTTGGGCAAGLTLGLMREE